MGCDVVQLVSYYGGDFDVGVVLEGLEEETEFLLVVLHARQGEIRWSLGLEYLKKEQSEVSSETIQQNQLQFLELVSLLGSLDSLHLLLSLLFIHLHESLSLEELSLSLLLLPLPLNMLLSLHLEPLLSGPLVHGHDAAFSGVVADPGPGLDWLLGFLGSVTLSLNHYNKVRVNYLI